MRPSAFHAPETSASVARAHVVSLLAERRAARVAGLGDNATYMRDLEDELAAARAAYVGLAVTEIATLRGRLRGPDHG